VTQTTNVRSHSRRTPRGSTTVRRHARRLPFGDGSGDGWPTALGALVISAFALCVWGLSAVMSVTAAILAAVTVGALGFLGFTVGGSAARDRRRRQGPKRASPRRPRALSRRRRWRLRWWRARRWARARLRRAYEAEAKGRAT
jgi:hypothetical protein